MQNCLASCCIAGTANNETQQPQGRELSYDLDEDQEQPQPARSQAGDESGASKAIGAASSSSAGKSVVALLILVGLAAIISWQWPHFSELYRSVAIVVKQQSTTLFAY